MPPSPTSAAPPLLLYGASGFGREVAWLAETATVAREVSAFIDDAASGSSARNGIPVLDLASAAARFPGAEFIAAVGDPALRERLAGKAIAAGLVPTTLVAGNVAMSRWVTIGAGTVICAGSILTTNITLGAHCQVNLDCTIGHDVVLDDYATLAPGVHVSGCVHIGRGAYVGTGASIINGLPNEPMVIGAGATVGAGAVVTRSVAPGVTVVGVPARARG